MSGMSGGSEIPERRARREKYYLIHCSDDDGALVCPNSVELWKTLRRAAEIRRHEEILGIAVNSPDEIPEDYYHRKCRSIFTMKRDLDRIHANEKTESRKDIESAEGASVRETPST